MRTRSVLSAVLLTGGLALFCPPAYATPHKSVIEPDIVQYECTNLNTQETQSIRLRIALTVPNGAIVNQETTIEWSGAYADGSELRAPATGLPADTKLYAYASIRDLPQTTSATGVGAIGAVGPGEVIPLPAQPVLLKTTPRSTGTGAVRPAAVNFGTGPTEPLLRCQVQNADDALRSYPLVVTAAGRQPAPDPNPARTTPGPSPTASSPSPGPSRAATPRPTPTPSPSRTPRRAPVVVDAVDGLAPRPRNEIEKTPIGGAATGAGGTAGPDGRLLVLTGSLLTLAALSGLFLRRRALARR